MSNEEKSMPPSCKACTFFCENETEENCGYCLAFDDCRKKGESLKIPHGCDEDTAKKCSWFFRNVKGFDATKMAIVTLRTDRNVRKMLNRVEVLLAFIAGFEATIAVFSLLK